MKYLIAFIFLWSTATAADFLATFSQYDDKINQKLGLATAGTSILTDTVIHDFVREAVIELMPQVRGDQVTTKISVAYKQDVYSLDTTVVGVRAVSIASQNGRFKKALRYVPQALWYEQVHQKTDGEKEGLNYPSFYDFTDDQIFIYPTPYRSQTDTLYVYGFRKVPSIAAVDSLAVIPQKYRPLMVSYAAYLCAASISSPKTGLLLQESEKRAQALGVQLYIKEADVKTGN